MASKKSKSKNQIKPKEANTTARSTRMMQIIFLIISVMIVLSMILAATIKF
jgi:hypothetical protein